MASETLYKLQPTRTMQLRGFDRRGANAAFVASADTGWMLTGTWRDMADFAVLELWNADNFFEHYSIKYLPDFDFSGMVLEFDLAYTGCQNPLSTRYDWQTWSKIQYDGGMITPEITAIDTRTKASATVTVVVNEANMAMYDRLTLWFENFAFDYILPYTLQVTYDFYAQGAGFTHTITVGANIYDYTEGPGESSAQVAAGIAALVTDTRVSVSVNSYQVTLRRAQDTDEITSVWSTWGTYAGLHQIKANTVAKKITDQINAATYGGTIGLTATRTNNVITITADKFGADGNRIKLYTLNKNDNVKFDGESYQLGGGTDSSNVHFKLDFSALGITTVRKLWMTFAPELPSAGSAFPASREFSITATNWTVTDPNGKRPLKLAGPGSIRVPSKAPTVHYTGSSWTKVDSRGAGHGWLMGGFGMRARTYGDKMRLTYRCDATHELWLGTSLYSDRGKVKIKLDGTEIQASFSCSLSDLEPINTRRKIATGVAAGTHLVEIELLADYIPMVGYVNSGYFYFDFIEAAVTTTTWADPATVYSNISAAVDYGTDHTYKMPPKRLVWALWKMGLRGQINDYVSVFWWNQRKRVGGVFKTLEVTISGTPDGTGTNWLRLVIGATTITKTLFPADTTGTIVDHFVFFINETFISLWAEKVSSTRFDIHMLTPEWTTAISKAKDSTAMSISFNPDQSPVGQPNVNTYLETKGTEGVWEIDTTQTPVINTGAKNWHAAFCSEIASLSLTLVLAFSMELVNPPESATEKWASRYPDGTTVSTDTGFANLSSIHCAFNTPVNNYHKEVYKQAAGLMATAGLTPWLQFGEYLWWFFSRSRNLGVTGASNTTPIQLTVPGHNFVNGDKVLVTGVVGNTAANGWWTVANVSGMYFDLAGSVGNGNFTVNVVKDGTWSARCCGKGMGYYDDDTKAAALAALGRDLYVFHTQNDDTAGHTADTDFLAARLKTYVDNIVTYVKTTYPTAKFEVLYANDVLNEECYYTADSPWPQGGRLNAAVSTPSEWLTKTGSNLDRIKMEALSWGAEYRNLRKAEEGHLWPITSPRSWSKTDVHLLMPWFNGGCIWEKEYVHAALRKSFPHITFWAYDHLCLISWPLNFPVQEDRNSFIY